MVVRRLSSQPKDFVRGWTAIPTGMVARRLGPQPKGSLGGHACHGWPSTCPRVSCYSQETEGDPFRVWTPGNKPWMRTLCQCFVTALCAIHPADDSEGTALAGLVLVYSTAPSQGPKGTDDHGDLFSKHPDVETTYSCTLSGALTGIPSGVNEQSDAEKGSKYTSPPGSDSRTALWVWRSRAAGP